MANTDNKDSFITIFRRAKARKTQWQEHILTMFDQEIAMFKSN